MTTLQELFQRGIQHHQSGRLTQAEECYQQVLQQQPQNSDALHLLGTLAYQVGRSDRALELLGKAIALDPDKSDYYFNLGMMQYHRTELAAACHSFHQALHLNPTMVLGWFNLGNCYRRMGDHIESQKAYREALRLKPDYYQAHTNLLFLTSYNVLCDPGEMLSLHQEWDRVQGKAGRAGIQPHTRGTEPERRLRIGYVSPNFCQHAVSYFFESILAAHDRKYFDVYCYAQVAQPDAITERLQSLADGWFNTCGVSDAEVVRRIHSDNIDILIDLAGHTAHNRLSIFTYKPAPIQATYLGYCTSTGIASMDYWITDSILHPEDTVEQASESHYRLPRCWLSYRPADNAPAVSSSSSIDRPLTFGSLNELSKLSPAVIALWSEILRAVPDSRLLLKTSTLHDVAAQTRITTQFTDQGIQPQRLTLLPSSSDYLKTYHDIDIALDPFPRTGGATTADALWMGVPVITLTGERMIERQGMSMLSAVGLDHLIAHSKQDYVAKAIALASDGPRQPSLRASLRKQMAASPLCDGVGLTKDLETAYQKMWRYWCQRNDGDD